METITLILAIVMLVFGILQIILFFKMWGMADNVERLCSKVCYNELQEKPHKVDIKTDIIIWGAVIIIIFLILYFGVLF